MRLPFVIDNRDGNTMADVLNDVLARSQGRAVDAATAYFNVQGFRLVARGLEKVGGFRLLLGAEYTKGKDVGLSEKSDHLARDMKGDLNLEAFDPETLDTVEELVAFLRRPEVEVRHYARGFLHAKAWLFHEDQAKAGERPGRNFPLHAIVGSSNFTKPGLTTNRELNVTHSARIEANELRPEVLTRGGELVLSRVDNQALGAAGAQAIIELDEWFEDHWAQSLDFKQELIDLLEASKFGTFQYTPWQVYLKALYTGFRDELGADGAGGAGASAVELTKFQDDAFIKARRILSRYDGVMVADSVGLGKTWIGKRLLEEFGYHKREKVLVICPANLQKMWKEELKSVTTAGEILSQEKLGILDEDGEPKLDLEPYSDADIILIDESHNFRAKGSNRYSVLTQLLDSNNRMGSKGRRKKVILLTATPINNDLFDLYNQLLLFTGNELSYFAAAGIGDLKKYFLRARKELGESKPGEALYNLLEEVVIRRTRSFIKTAYPNATIHGKPIKWPKRQLRTLKYDLESTYGGIYEKIVEEVDDLQLPQYQPDEYLLEPPGEEDQWKLGRQQGLVGIFKARYLKRFESSVEAFRITVKRALNFVTVFEKLLKETGRLLDAERYNQAMRLLSRESEDSEATDSVYDAFNESELISELMQDAVLLDESLYDKKAMLEAAKSDRRILTTIQAVVLKIDPTKDTKLKELKKLLASPEMKGRKVLIFTYFRDTAAYLGRELSQDADPLWFANAGSPRIEQMDSGDDPERRARKVRLFAPVAAGARERVPADAETQIMISTDVLSEGHNLQDCGFLLNYDLHWNPVRMIQRAGRIDRIGSEHHELTVANNFPDEGLEKLLGIMQSLTKRIETIDKSGFHDASVLGEVPHPTVFNTLRKIKDEDNTVIEEEENDADLASNEGLIAQLKGYLSQHSSDEIQELPDGIHSSLEQGKGRGIFFAFSWCNEGQERHYWRFWDAASGQILDNRFQIAKLIACKEETERAADPFDLTQSVFEAQEAAKADVLKEVLKRKTVQVIPPKLEARQQELNNALLALRRSPDVKQADVEVIRSRANIPLTEPKLKKVQRAIKSLSATGDVAAFLAAIDAVLPDKPAPSAQRDESAAGPEKPEDLHLVCFEYVS